MMWTLIFRKMVEGAGIVIGRDMLIKDHTACRDIVLKGSLGFGESYMQHKWETPDLFLLIRKIFEGALKQKKLSGFITDLGLSLRSRFFNLQDRKNAPDLAETHYNAGNYLFQSFLDPNMIYSCAYFKDTDDLEQAQINKVLVVGNKLNLQPGDRVLDIGCGWGGTARILSERFDVQVTGVSDAGEMINYANKHNASDKVDFIQSDYRDIKGKYDKIYNVGFMEAVGPKNYRRFMQKVNSLLTDTGIFLTHTIGGHRSTHVGDAWLDKYIFPHGVLPSVEQIENASKGIFMIRDFEAFGKYYEITLDHWSKRLNRNWNSIRDRFNDPGKFKRMMDFYLLSCKAAFSTKHIDLWQFVMTKQGAGMDYKVYRF